MYGLDVEQVGGPGRAQPCLEIQPQYVTSSTDSPRPCLVSCVGRPGLGHFIWTRFAFSSVSDTSNHALDLAVRRHCYGGQHLHPPTPC